jgi:hypothetical protein
MSVALQWSAQRSGGFQIRHRRLGIFQGTAAGLACWHPSSGLPEYGLCRFETEGNARAYVEFFCSETCPEPFNRDELTIEPFDRKLHETLISEYPHPSAWEFPT